VSSPYVDACGHLTARENGFSDSAFEPRVGLTALVTLMAMQRLQQQQQQMAAVLLLRCIRVCVLCVSVRRGAVALCASRL